MDHQSCLEILNELLYLKKITKANKVIKMITVS